MTPSKKGTLKVEYVPIKSVKPAKNNSRIHAPEQVDQIRRLIEAFGWTKPIIVDERREILAGHGAYYAIDLEPRYVDAIVTRWQTLTGQQATHGEEKRTFEAISKARHKAKARAA